jgi:hypothetical protein
MAVEQLPTTSYVFSEEQIQLLKEINDLLKQTDQYIRYEREYLAEARDYKRQAGASEQTAAMYTKYIKEANEKLEVYKEQLLKLFSQNQLFTEEAKAPQVHELESRNNE